MKNAPQPWILILVAVFLIQYLMISKNEGNRVAYSEFLRRLKLNEVESVVVSQGQIEGVWKGGDTTKSKHFLAYKVDDPNLMNQLRESGVTISGVPERGWWSGIASWGMSFLLLLFFWRMLFSRMQGPQSEFLGIGKSKAKIYVERELKTKFNDVAGVDEAKAELQEVVDFLKSPEQFTRLGGRMPKGILLVGPPGTGKTLLARAVAGEAGVSFFSINGSEFVEMFVGLGAARVRDLFQQARKSVPCILFIDELDALGKARGISAIMGGANEEKEQTLNQLLAEIDGFDPSPGIILLAATNRPEILDPALLRSGRFDRQVVIDKPDKKGRLAILKIHFKKVVLSSELDPEEIAAITSGFSGADLENLVNESALVATRRKAKEIEMSDFTAGVERIVGGLERKSRVMSEKEKLRVAYHEMGHATVSLALGESVDVIHKVSLIPRGVGALGYTMKRPIEDRYLMSQEELEKQLMVLLGGRASEQFFYHDRSTGAADDLDRATDLAKAMVMQYGMGEQTGLMTYERIRDPYLKLNPIDTHEFSESTAELIDQEMKRMVDGAFRQALALVEQNQEFIKSVTQELLKKETLSGEELREWWKGKIATVVGEKSYPPSTHFKNEGSTAGGILPA
jgi:cell division protease FtsH